jgi:glycosyltransferase involved in cell wall biosynthesis
MTVLPVIYGEQLVRQRLSWVLLSQQPVIVSVPPAGHLTIAVGRKISYTISKAKCVGQRAFWYSGQKLRAMDIGGTFCIIDKKPDQRKKGARVRVEPIRVLVVAARFLPDIGGVETHVYEVTRRLAKRGDLDLTVLTTDRSGTRPFREEFEGFTVFRCRAYPQSRDYYFSPGIYHHIISQNYDLIHCQGIHTAVPILAMMAARWKRIPYVVTFHTGGHSSSLRRRIRDTQWRMLGPLLRRAAVTVAVSRFEQQMFQKFCRLDASRVKLIQNGGTLPSLASRAEVIPGRIISSGRLERYKGHHRLIEALPIVQRSIPNATVQILGSGPYERQLRSLITTLGLKDSVTIECIAPSDRGRMAKALGGAAVVAALSEYEAHPLAVMEALTLGTPTVGLNTAGISDLVEDGLVEGVPKEASPTDIARVLVAVLEGQSVCSPAELPTWEIAASDLAQVYVDAVEAAPKPVYSQDL